MTDTILEVCCGDLEAWQPPQKAVPDEWNFV